MLGHICTISHADSPAHPSTIPPPHKNANHVYHRAINVLMKSHVQVVSKVFFTIIHRVGLLALSRSLWRIQVTIPVIHVLWNVRLVILLPLTVQLVQLSGITETA